MQDGTVITRRFEFDAAHRVLGHGGKCRHLHGHRYVAEVSVVAPVLDDLDRVVDFGVIKARLGPWIDDNWDHNILLNTDDPLWGLYTDLKEGLRSDLLPIFAGRQPYCFHKQNPTAEVIARTLFDVAVNLLPEGLNAVSVKVYETPNCSALYVPALVFGTPCRGVPAGHTEG